MRWIVFILLVGILASCKKQPLPENTWGNAVFYLNGNINGVNQSFVAGDNGFYMHTHTERIYSLDIIEGNLSDENESLKIQFFKNPTSTVTLPVGNYQHLNFNNLIKQVYVDSISEGAITDFEWNINGENYSQINIDTLIKQPGKYEICLTINYNNGCSQSLCSDYMIGFSDTYSIDFIYKIFEDSTIQCIPQIISENEVDHIEWFVNENPLSSTSLLENNIVPGIHHYEMVVHFKDGMVLKKAKNIRHQSQDCYFEEIRIEGNKEFEVREGVIISYVDNEGQEYVSFYETQPEDFGFEIVDKVDYKNNSNGQKVLQLFIQFDVVLKSINNPEKIKIFNDFKGKFGVAIP